MRKNAWRSVATVAAISAFAGTGPATAVAVGDHGSARAASSCASGPWYPDISYTFGSPYSFRYGSTSVVHAQLRISDKNHARVTTRRSGVRLYLERTDGRVCGPRSVIPRGQGRYTAAVRYLDNPGHGVRACIKYPGAGTMCGAWKRE